MSDASRGPREWRFYVKDMGECAEKVLLFTDGFDVAAAPPRHSRESGNPLFLALTLF